jgi:hypothetical protein
VARRGFRTESLFRRPVARSVLLRARGLGKRPGGFRHRPHHLDEFGRASVLKASARLVAEPAYADRAAVGVVLRTALCHGIEGPARRDGWPQERARRGARGGGSPLRHATSRQPEGESIRRVRASRGGALDCLGYCGPATHLRGVLKWGRRCHGAYGAARAAFETGRPESDAFLAASGRQQARPWPPASAVPLPSGPRPRSPRTEKLREERQRTG